MTSDEDLDAIMAVMKTAFDPHWREAWTRAQVRDSLAMPTTHALLIHTASPAPGIPGDVAGFTLSRQAADEEELLLIAVNPDYRGRGLGTRLIEQLVKESSARGVTRMFLEMRSNNPAQSLYRRSGFNPVGVRPAYYRALDGQSIDAITFVREL